MGYMMHRHWIRHIRRHSNECYTSPVTVTSPSYVTKHICYCQVYLIFEVFLVALVPLLLAVSSTMVDNINISTGKLSHAVRESHERKALERKRNILYLIKSFLKESKLEKSFETLSTEASLNDDYEVCDNIDLDTIIQEYTTYYFAKFDKYPKLCKKLTLANGNTEKKKRNSYSAPLSKQINTKQGKIQNFQNTELNLSVTKLALRESNNTLEEYMETKYEDPHIKIQREFEGRTDEWKEMAEQIKREIVTSNLGITWQDCIGMENIVQLLQEAVIYPVKYPELFTGFISPWKGVLLFGPPGTGKTLIAKALACESKTTLINVTASTFISKWRGDSEKLVRVLFEVARYYAPTTIFIDEIDALVSRRDECQHDASRRFKSELLTQMDGIMGENENVFLLATTNLPWEVDSAMLRRFEKRIYVDLPNTESRKNIFKHYLSANSVCHFKDHDFEKFSELTYNLTGSDIKLICKEAHLSVVRKEFSKNGKPNTKQIKPPNSQDITTAIHNIKPSFKNIQEKYIAWKNNYGCL